MGVEELDSFDINLGIIDHMNLDCVAHDGAPAGTGGGMSYFGGGANVQEAGNYGSVFPLMEMVSPDDAPADAPAATGGGTSYDGGGAIDQDVENYPESVQQQFLDSVPPPMEIDP
jgi:hypothetical protein